MSEENEPVVPIPTDSKSKIGRKVSNLDGKGEGWLFKPEEWIKKKKDKET